MDTQNIRNFVIIAHIDHGKSTLADRLLEATHTVEHRKMQEQYLDQLELERERGITIKMAPVRMIYEQETRNTKHETRSGDRYVLNLIDTPGHPDFGYEVSRALEAVEGAVLLVDGTQGIQAQTLSNFWAAKKAGLSIIGAVNKVDLQIPDIEKSVLEVAELLEVSPDAIHRISGKTGEGVEGLLEDVVVTVPPPRKVMQQESVGEVAASRALIFDSFYDDHKGIIAVVRVFNGSFSEGDKIRCIATNTSAVIKEVGCFTPAATTLPALEEGHIGYVVTGIKEVQDIKIGDTIITSASVKGAPASYALPGYKEPNPVVFVSFFPDEADEFDDLKKALERLRLNDSAFVFEPDYNEVLGRGFKGGFLGKLHFEIVSQRLEREFGVETVTSFPSVAYKVKTSASLGTRVEREGEYAIIKNPADLPAEYDTILEPMIDVEIILPRDMLGHVIPLQQQFRWQGLETKNMHERTLITTTMPLSELISDFDDKLKSVSGGFASFSYEEAGYQQADLVRLDMMVAGEVVPGLSRIVPRQDVERVGRFMAQRLKDTLPQQQFVQAVQAYALGRVIARETIPALRKDVTGYLYGGDRTRKMKLWKKQKEGKKRLKASGRVTISASDFKKLLEG
jgi:GTP-binding protein LepA